MPRRANISEGQLQFLRVASAMKIPYSTMAREIGVCTDTCKRVLHKNRIVQFTGAKYIAAELPEIQMWSRPCSCCGDKTPRPKWQFYCQSCKRKLGMAMEE